eukprot:Gb_03070 [translate_table: standard]
MEAMDLFGIDKGKRRDLQDEEEEERNPFISATTSSRRSNPFESQDDEEKMSGSVSCTATEKAAVKPGYLDLSLLPPRDSILRSLFLQKSPFSQQHRSPSPGAYAFRSPTPCKLQQPTAQLTIFYAGTAKAIMVFAGNESSCFGHHSARTPTSMAPATPLISTPSRPELPSPSPVSIFARVPLNLQNSPKLGNQLIFPWPENILCKVFWRDAMTDSTPGLPMPITSSYIFASDSNQRCLAYSFASSANKWTACISVFIYAEFFLSKEMADGCQ